MRTHNLGAHPIVQHFLERMTVAEIIRSCVGGSRQSEVDHGQATVALVHNLVQSPGPLYRVSDWAEPLEAHVLGLTPGQKASINDDRIARALDALSSERGRSIFFRLALRTIKQFNLDTGRIHHDTTTVTVTGQYASSRSAPVISLGNNKDYRPCPFRRHACWCAASVCWGSDRGMTCRRFALPALPVGAFAPRG
jgi:hypothetical protein